MAAGSALTTVFRHAFGQATLDRLACAAEVTPAIVTPTGVPLALGRAQRLATADQMKALWLRDAGCVMPGCEHTLLHEYRWTLEHDPDRPGLLRWRPPDGRPPIPARHSIDRDRGHKHPLW